MGKDPHTEPAGSIVGGAIAKHLADVVVAVRARMAPIEQSHRIDVNNAWMEDAERRLQPLLGAILKDLNIDSDTPEWVAMLKTTFGEPRNQTDFLIYLAGLIGAIITLLPALGQVEIAKTVQKAWANQPNMPLSPAILADMVERNIITEGEGAAEALHSGVNGERFRLMVKDSGEPPGLESMVALWKRGKLGLGDLERMIRYSRVRTEWTQAVIDAFERPMSGADAISAVVKGVISEAAGRSYFIQNGGMSEQWPALLATAGDSIGVQQANSLYLHGLISHEQLRRVILHSRINPEFEPMAELLRFHYLNIFQVSKAVSNGGATPEQATKWLTEQGYPADQIAAFVHSAHKDNTVKHRDVTEAQVIQLYEAHMITEGEAHAALVSLGYDDGEAGAVIAAYDARKILASQAKALEALRKGYLAHRLTVAQISGALDAEGVSAPARDHLIADWTLERNTTYKHLTDAQIVAAAKKGFLTLEEAAGRLERSGYAAEDASILLALGGAMG